MVLETIEARGRGFPKTQCTGQSEKLTRAGSQTASETARAREERSRSVIRRTPYHNRRLAKALGHMQIRHLNGRMERRLPIIVAVRLSRVRDLPAGEEVTYTDNVSVHGARVVSNCSWRPGEPAQIAPLQKEPSMQGEVVYCQSLGKKGFCVGFRFQEPVTWSVLSRYCGT